MAKAKAPDGHAVIEHNPQKLDGMKEALKSGDEMSVEDMQRAKAKLELEMAALQLEDLQTRVQKERDRRAEIVRAHAAQQRSLDDANASILAGQEICQHRKGGKNLEGILNGHDSNYSIIKHTYPWGKVVVMCTRCCKEWNEPVPALKKSDPELYKEQLAEYRIALKWPTDNEPSGSQIFTFSRAS